MLNPSNIFSRIEIKDCGSFNMDNCNLFHGSNLEIINPRVIHSKKKKDFGPGFYVTKFKHQAERWAFRNKAFGLDCIVSVFNFKQTVNKLKIKIFEQVDDEWVDFIANCRSGISHNYDIVEGPMADDKIFNFAQMYLRGDMPKSIFIDYCKFNYPTHQICFCTKEALSCLEFVKSYEVEDNKND